MRVWLMDKAWYLAFWVGMLIAARLWLVNPILRALERIK